MATTRFCGPRNGREVFDPQDFVGLSLWLDSSWGLVLTGASVTGWTDRSNRGHTYVQVNPAQKPVRTLAALNGYPSIDFTPANSSNMSSGTMTIADFFDATKNHGSVALVVKLTSGVADNCVFGADAAAVFTSWVGLFLVYIDGQIYWDAGNATNGPIGARFFPTIGTVTNAYAIYVFVRDGTVSRIYKNGSLIGSVTVGTTYISGLPTVLLGGSTNGGIPGQFADMSLVQMCVWQSALSANQVTILSRAWGPKYAITVA